MNRAEDNNDGSLNKGDAVKLLRADESWLKSLPKSDQLAIKNQINKIMLIEGFDEYGNGYVELEFTEKQDDGEIHYHTIWVEPKDVEKASEAEIIEAWIAAQKAENEGFTHRANPWAIDYLIDLAHKDPDKLFDFIPKILLADNSEKIILHVGAGPLQDIVNFYSDEYIEKISILARTSIDFRAALKNVIVDNECNHELSKLINSFK